ncbi:ABC transporter permease [Microbacterium gorillae]|uniref:ABC transporter permease n=1 Tax=Microbacterium gorillae TaxID=1231063 RepID=UPI00058E7713|nr:ABC transporter permease [Microbacterium gorillae]
MTSPSTVTTALRSLRAERSTSRVRTALRDRRSIIGLVLIGITLLIALIGPLLAPHPVDAYIAAPFAPPGDGYPLGTDAMGQDVLSRVLSGGRTVVWMSVISATIGTVVGALVGMLAGYRGGWADEVLMRLCDVFLALPMMVFVLLVVAVFGRAPWLLVALIAFSHVPSAARVIRGATLDVSTREYVESAQALGAGPLRVNITQVLPNIIPTLSVEYGLRIVWSVSMLAGLSVLGLGVAAPAADWGLMINENRAAFSFQPLGVLVPLALLAMFALGANLVSEGIARSLNVYTSGSNA